MMHGPQDNAFPMDAAPDELETQRSAMDSALRVLGRKPATCHEIERALSKKGFPLSVINAVLDRLKQMNYLNDERYAKDWIQDRIQFNPAGKLWLRHELKKRGIAPETIDKCLIEVFEHVDELELAMSVADRLKKKRKNIPDIKFYRTVSNALMSRGFDWETIRIVIERINGQDED